MCCLAFVFVAIGLFVRYTIPWSLGESEMFGRVRTFFSWVSATYSWTRVLANVDFALAFLCAGIGIARIFVWHI